MSEERKGPHKLEARSAMPKMILIQAYTPSELASIYGMKWGVMNQWLKYLEQFTGPRISRYYSPKQVEIIFDHLGLPKEKEADEEKMRA
jgi:hypothetical protein